MLAAIDKAGSSGNGGSGGTQNEGAVIQQPQSHHQPFPLTSNYFLKNNY